MPADTDNIIWGIPVDKDIGVENPFKENIDVSIKSELFAFLSEQIQKFEPDRIIVVERKGTAILRALKNQAYYALNWPWEKVISSAVIERAPDNLFENQRILIFDDMLRTGWHIWNELLPKLKERAFWNSIKDKAFVASFAIHSRYDETKSELPQTWFYKNLSTVAYNHLRGEIVTMLQQAGSLMLDTEHIEVRVHVKCDVRTFFEALSRRAKAINFYSAGERLNATIFYPDDPKFLLPQEILPEDTITDKIVKKCRVIRRKGNEFALIPLCFPSILAKPASSWLGEEKFNEILGDRKQTPIGRFYNVALLAGIEVLKWVLADLLTLSPEDYRLMLPSQSITNELSDGYTLSHLRVMYPNINIEKLTQYIHMKVDEARTKAVKLRSRKLPSANLGSFPDEQLKEWAVQLCELIRNRIDEKIAIAFLEGMAEKPHPCGMTAEEIFDLGNEVMKLPHNVISVLFDILIDNAYLVTHVQILPDADGVSRVARTFEPDGEVISELIRKHSLMWGLPYEFAKK